MRWTEISFNISFNVFKNSAHWFFCIEETTILSEGEIDFGLFAKFQESLKTFCYYPNTYSLLKKLTVSLELQSRNTALPYEVRLFDTFGREVMYFDWQEDQKIISVSDLASGVYIYRIIDEKGRMASGKIVKE